jgi:hypothetical protein
MKKIYESPNTVIVKIETSAIMVLSNYDENLNDTGADGSNALSSGYRNSLWGDNE